MLDRLEEGYLRERAFVDDAAHELRTPLTTLSGELELATSRPRSHVELDATVRSARRQTERLVGLANDLLVLARSAHGELPLRREPLGVKDVVEGVTARAQTLAREVPVATSEVPGGAANVVADPMWLGQALENLVANALQHGAGPVTLGAVADSDAVIFTVDDQGGPIDPDLAQRAFDRFTRGDSARAGTGTGLGLAIVKAIATAHGGGAGLEASPSGGTRAWLRLPAAGS
jgi:signal transduction histidine kinase